MAVRIRLRRMGKKKEVHYRVVVAEACSAREGRFLETIGYLNPRTNPPQIRLDEERARHWLKRGAQPTDTVRSILLRQGLLERMPPAGEEERAEPASAAEDLTPESPSGEVSADAGTDRDGGEGPG